MLTRSGIASEAGSIQSLCLEGKALVLTVLLLSSAVLSTAQNVTIEEYRVRSNTGPNGIAAGSDGALWFAGSSSLGVIGRMTTDGVVTNYYSLPTCCAPEMITAGPDGALWFTKSYSNQIGQISTTGTIKEYTLPHAAYYGESYPWGIASGPDGALWFTESAANSIGRITTSGSITEYVLPNVNSSPNDITVGPDRAMWFTESSGSRIGRISTSGVITEYPLPSNDRYPRGIVAGTDGRIWFVEYSNTSIAAMTMQGEIVEYPVKSSSPVWPELAEIAAGPDGALWFTEADGNRIGRITTGGTVTEYVVPTPNSLPLQILLGPDGAMWFTEGFADQIGRIILPETIPATSVTLTSSLNPSLFGQAVTFTATVASSGGIPPNGEIVTFYNGTAVLGTGPLSGGAAMLTTSALPAGVFTITARYPGDSKFGTSTSAGLRQTVNATTKSATTTVFTSSLNPSTYGQKVTFTAVVTTSGPVPPTGTVRFSWSDGFQTFTIGTATLNSAGVATLTKSNLNADAYPLAAVYKGDANNLSSTSAVMNQTVLQTTSAATIDSSVNPSTVGQAVTFTATITSPTVTASGPVTFKAGTTVLGTAQLSKGKAMFTTSSLSAGSTVVKAIYNGDSNIKGSSASVTQVVQP